VLSKHATWPLRTNTENTFTGESDKYRRARLAAGGPAQMVERLAVRPWSPALRRGPPAMTSAVMASHHPVYYHTDPSDFCWRMQLVECEVSRGARAAMNEAPSGARTADRAGGRTRRAITPTPDLCIAVRRTAGAWATITV
jgi:hypothetical protein